MASRDLLGVFGGGGEGAPTEGAGGQSDEIELRLGLSLGGRFGTDRSPEAKRPRLVRSSSIASVCSVSVGDPSPAAPLPLLRTSSLPTETEEERWRRREMQCRRRMEARRKRLERRSSMGSSSSGLGKPGREDGGDVINGFQLRRSIGSQGSSSSANAREQGPGFSPSGQHYRRSILLCKAPTEAALEPWRAESLKLLKPLCPCTALVTLCTAQSREKSGVKPLTRRWPQRRMTKRATLASPVLGTLHIRTCSNQCEGLDRSAVCQSTDARSPSTSDNTNEKSALPRPQNGTMTEQPPLRTLRSLTMRTSSTSDIRKSMMEDMPMVSSKVEGLNGRKIDGFLYRYNKGEDVRIVCVCHGNFLTPAEFVKHAGGGDVSNPLRHIVVNPAPSVFL